MPVRLEKKEFENKFKSLCIKINERMLTKQGIIASVRDSNI